MRTWTAIGPGAEPAEASGSVTPEARLRGLADSLPDRALGERLARLYDVSLPAMAALRELDPGIPEPDPDNATADLAVFEALAPAISDTMVRVHALLEAGRALFPPDEAPLAGEQALPPPQAIPAAVSAGLENLSEAITLFAQQVRSPTVAADPWGLLSKVQEHRGRLWTALGEMLFQTAQAIAPVSRREVIPGFGEETAAAVAARRAVTDLKRVLEIYRARLEKADPLGAGPCARALLQALDAFRSSRGFRLLRALDKRGFLALRSALAALGDQPARDALVEQIDRLLTFAQRLSAISRRSCLVEHDGECLAATGVALERAQAQLESAPEEAARQLGRAAAAARELYGRDPALDAWLRQMRKQDLSLLGPSELALELEALRRALAACAAG